MTEAMHHLHKHFGYLIFVLLILQFLLALLGGGKKEGMRRSIDVLQTLSVRIVGPIILLAGVYLWHVFGYSVGTPWLLGALFLWAPMEIVAKRMIRPALETSEEGVNSSKLVLGATLQLIIVVAIFGLMTANAVYPTGS